MNLFSDNTEIHLDMIDADVYYYPHFFILTEAHVLFQSLLENTLWQQDDITVYGKTHKATQTLQPLRKQWANHILIVILPCNRIYSVRITSYKI